MKRRFSGRARGLGALLAKCLILAVGDGLAVWLALAADPLSYGGKFLWVLLNLLWTLVLTDGAALLYPVVKGRIGRGYARRWMRITGGYCLLGVLLTPLVYRRLSPGGFGLFAGALLVLYAALTAGLLLASRRRVPAPSVNGAALTVRMLELGSGVQALEPLLNPRQWEGLQKAYAQLRTCWEFASPFGRSPLPVDLELETAIAHRVDSACVDIRRLSREPTADGLRQVIIELLDIAEQLKLREKQEAD